VIIECPACHTRYRTDNSLVVTESTLFECSRDQCGHVFPYLPDSLQETASRPLIEDPLVEPSGPPLTASSLQQEAEDPPPVAPLPKPHPSLKAPVSPPQAMKNLVEDFTEPEDFSLDPPILSSPSSSPLLSAATEEIQRDNPVKRSPPSRPRPRPAPISTFSIWSVLGLLGLLVVGYYFLGSRWRTNLGNTEGMLAHFPFVGSSFVASQFSPQHIVLSDLKSGFWTTKDSKRVFAISGKATNNASVPASTIQIEGQLHNVDGETIEQRTISCGMGTTAESLPTLTTHEISVLQGLMPPKQFHVAPGQSVNFLIVFPDPPAAVTELSCRVATAQFGTS